MGHIPVLLMYEIVKTEYKISKSKLLISKIEWNFQLINCIMLMLNRSVVSSSLRPHFFFQARILEWVAISSSRGSSWPRDQTCISVSPALAGRFFTTCTTWEVHSWMKLLERKFPSWVSHFLFPKRYHKRVFNRTSPNINTCRYCFFASLPPCDSQTACKIHHCCTR